MSQSNGPNQDNIVDFQSYKSKRNNESDLARGRKPLYISHLDGKLTGSPHLNRPQGEDFGDRLARIRVSLEKINRLMQDLKKTSQRTNDEAINQPVSIRPQSTRE